MRSSVVSLSLAAIIGVVIGLLLQSPEPSSTVSTALSIKPNAEQSQNTTLSSSSESQPLKLAELSQKLQQEILARETLQKDVETLRQKLATLSPQHAQAAIDTQKTSAPPADAIHRSTEDAWFNQQALIDSGMEQAAAEQLKTRFEEMELEKLYLRDQAVREGWSGGKRYREERQKLEAKSESIKQELGEDAYDAYLFASGKSNRVAVQSVLSGSAAGNAGMISGDQVIRYDGERIYNWRDLRTATTQGDLTETIAVQILRDNKQMEFYVQRGPLGIRMTSVSAAP